jgi:hypothetical protein
MRFAVRTAPRCCKPPCGQCAMHGPRTARPNRPSIRPHPPPQAHRTAAQRGEEASAPPTWAVSCCGALQLRSQALKRRPSSWCSDPLPPSPPPFLHYTLLASCYCHTRIRLRSRLGGAVWGVYTGSLTFQAFSCAGTNGVQWRTRRITAKAAHLISIGLPTQHTHAGR